MKDSLKTEKKPKLGIIGGLGPLAGAYFLTRITDMTDADKDQDHPDILMISVASTPDRTAFILKESFSDPVPCIVEAGKLLKSIGAEVIAIPCITAHYFHERIEDGIGLPVFNAIKDTAYTLKSQNIKKTGLLATRGTIKSRIFETELERNDIECLLPDDEDMEVISDLIYKNVKGGQKLQLDRFLRVTDKMLNNGAERIILGCTELSIIKRDYPIGETFIDVIDVLAMRAVSTCSNLRREYEFSTAAFNSTCESVPDADDKCIC